VTLSRQYLTLDDEPIYDLRLAAAGLYDIPRTRTFIGSKAFSVAGPKAWNSLPQSLRDITYTATFKIRLKIHLFNNVLLYFYNFCVT